MTWYKLLLLPSDPQIDSEGLDSICSELMEAGASGTTIDTPPEIACFVESSSAAEMQRLSLIAEQLGCRVLSHEEVLEENWTASCPELWQPVAAGTLQVVPVESPTDAREVPAGAIKIIPGLGFGTGHHPTTNMLLGELSQLQPSTPFAAVLDLGTGSGILGIAAAKLFGAPVTAIDIDPLAVANAADNVALNGVEGLVPPDPRQRVRRGARGALGGDHPRRLPRLHRPPLRYHRPSVRTGNRGLLHHSRLAP